MVVIECLLQAVMWYFDKPELILKIRFILSKKNIPDAKLDPVPKKWAHPGIGDQEDNVLLSGMFRI